MSWKGHCDILLLVIDLLCRSMPVIQQYKPVTCLTSGIHRLSPRVIPMKQGLVCLAPQNSEYNAHPPVDYIHFKLGWGVGVYSRICAKFGALLRMPTSVHMSACVTTLSNLSLDHDACMTHGRCMVDVW